MACLLAVNACTGDDDDETSTGGSTARGDTGGTAAKGGAGNVGGSGARGGTSTTGGAGGKGGGEGGRGGNDATGGEAGASGGSAGRTPSSGGEGGLETPPGHRVDPTQFDGKQVFRFDTFGDEVFWTETLKLNQAIQAALDPTTALGLGLKVDADALPAGILDTADLTSPATTIALLKLDAVVGVKGKVDSDGNLTSVGITCALCHSSVDDSVMKGIGSRVDGQANHDLDPGAIIALSPGLADDAASLDVLNSWGPGFYDARWNQDGINHPVVIPSIYGLADVPLETYTGDGPISYWNAYVAVTQMHGQGVFFDPRVEVAVIFDRDLVTPKLPALFDYEVSLKAPKPAADSFDADAAERGAALFAGAAKCGTCHQGDAHTDAAKTLHAASETAMEPVTAMRSATGLYRTTPLRGLLANGPYFHDGSAATLAEVVTHYDTALALGLTAEQQADLVEYLKSL